MSKVNTPLFRVAFPNVFKAKRNDLNGKDEYSLVALFPKGADLGPLKQAALAACEKAWGTDKKKWPKSTSGAPQRNPFRDQGDREKEKDGVMVLPQGYVRGNIYLNLKSVQRPGLVDANVQAIINESDFYGGCWAVASINAYAYNQGGNVGVNFGLGNIQKQKDDDNFGGFTKPEDDFAPVADNSDTTTTNSSADDLFS